MLAPVQRILFTLLALPVLVLGFGPAANADTIYVSWDGSGDYLTIQEGINAASDGDEVVVCDGVYTGVGNKDLDFCGMAITVRSENGPNRCKIDCEGHGRGFSFTQGETPAAVVDGFTIRNGYADHGGGVYCNDSGPTIVNCLITWNSGDEYNKGGGIYCVNSSAMIANCTIRENWARHGGGLFFMSGNPTVTNCVISDNAAAFGGGIYSQYSGGVISNCTITQNDAPFGGDGIYWNNSQQTLVNCILWDNVLHNVYGHPGITYSDVQGGCSGEGNIDVDPRFFDPQGDDFTLRSGSPCIDAGCNGGLPCDWADLDNDGDTSEITPFDLDGDGRFFDDPDTPDTGCGFSAVVDMGAYEFGDTGPQPCPGDMDGDREVDQSDLGVLLAAWGDTDTCDLDCDGDIDQADLGILLAHWGEGCP